MYLRSKAKVFHFGFWHYLPACAVLTAVGGFMTFTGSDTGPEASSREGFAQYAEYVFRLQNRVGSDALFCLEDADDYDQATVSKLSAAEERMLEACEALNTFALQQQAQRQASLLNMLEIRNEVSACHAATRTLEKFMQEIAQYRSGDSRWSRQGMRETKSL